MEINQTPIDRSLRAAAGLAILASPLVGFHPGAWMLAGLVPLLTGIIGYCPAYGLLGFTTCREGSYLHQKKGIVLPQPKGHIAHA